MHCIASPPVKSTILQDTCQQTPRMQLSCVAPVAAAAATAAVLSAVPDGAHAVAAVLSLT